MPWLFLPSLFIYFFSLSSIEFLQYASDQFDYIPCLIEIRSSLQNAKDRALRRARMTGRFTPDGYIEESHKELPEILRQGKFLIEKYNGIFAIFDNNLGGGSRLVKCDQ